LGGRRRVTRKDACTSFNYSPGIQQFSILSLFHFSCPLAEEGLHPRFSYYMTTIARKLIRIALVVTYKCYFSASRLVEAPTSISPFTVRKTFSYRRWQKKLAWPCKINEPIYESRLKSWLSFSRVDTHSCDIDAIKTPYKSLPEIGLFLIFPKMYFCL